MESLERINRARSIAERASSSNVDFDATSAMTAVGRRVLLVDETRMTRECLAYMLTVSAPDLELESVSRFEEAMQPADIVLWNIKSARMDESGVLAQLAQMRLRLQDPPVVVITDLDDTRLAMESLRHQLRGYIPTSLKAEIVVAAIRLVLAGATFIPEVLIRRCAEFVPLPTELHHPPPAQGAPGFTRRESDVLKQLRQGKPNKIIAHELDISESTVKVHVRHIMKKLHARNRTQVAFMTEMPGLMPPPVASLPAIRRVL